MMFKFGGFKVSLDLLNRRKKENNVDATTHSVDGAYRVKRDEFYDYGRNSSLLPINGLPSLGGKSNNTSTKQPSTIKPNKSTNDLIMQKKLPENVSSKSTPDVSQDPRGGTNAHSSRNAEDVRKKNIRTREQTKLEKQQLAQQKARDKAIAKEQAKQDKLRRDMEKQAAKEQARTNKLNQRRKKEAPPPPLPLTPPPQMTANNNNDISNRPYSTNTMHSSISTTSGPPPYSNANPSEVSNDAGNVTFGKPINEPTNSWDLISQHRQEMARPKARGVPRSGQKNMVMDLQYKLGDENTEA